MILILVRFMQIGRARKMWQICQLSRAHQICMNHTKKKIHSLFDLNKRGPLLTYETAS